MDRAPGDPKAKTYPVSLGPDETKTRPRLSLNRNRKEAGRWPSGANRSEGLWEVTLSNNRGKRPNRLTEKGLQTSIDPRSKGQN